MEQKITIEKDSLKIAINVKNSEWSNYFEKISSKKEEPAMLNLAFKKLQAKIMPNLYLKALEEATVYYEERVFINKINTSEIDFFVKFKIFPAIPKKIYKSLKIDFKYKPLSKEKVTVEIILMLINQTPEMVDPKYKIKRGDWLKIKLRGYLLGKKVPGWYKDIMIFRAGESGYFKEFDNAIIGMQKGDKKTVEKLFPKNHHSVPLRNKKGTFTIEILEIIDFEKRPMANDEFAKKVGIIEVSSYEQLKAYIKYVITEENHQWNLKLFGEDFFAKVLPKLDFDIPESLIQKSHNDIINEDRFKLLKLQLLPESRWKETEKNYDFLIIKKLKSDIVLDDIARQEKIAILNSEVEEGYEMLSKIQNITAIKAKKTFNWLEVRKFILNRKVMELLSNSKI